MNFVRRRIREPFAGLSHWFGVMMALVGFGVLMVMAADRPTYLVAFAVYGSSLILLYTASAAAHSLHCTPETTDTLTRLDYVAIFLLVAGSYTPICMITLAGPLGYTILALEWIAALGGMWLVFHGKYHRELTRTLLYVAMGWLAVVAAPTLVDRLPLEGIAWLLAGGLLYSIGAVIYATDRPNLWPGKFDAHDLWHTLVLVASACHFLVVVRFVA